MMRQEYKQLVQSKGHLPTGILGKGFSADFISKFLEGNLDVNESLSDITGVRYQGKDAFLILTSKRLICVSARSNANFEVILNIEISTLQKLSIAPSRGISLKKDNVEMRMYFVQEKTGIEFSNSLKSLNTDIELITALADDKHERILIFQAVIGFIVAFVLFGSCVYQSATNTDYADTSTDSEIIEACLRRYIKGDTVEAYEIEEAYRRCAP